MMKKGNYFFNIRRGMKRQLEWWWRDTGEIWVILKGVRHRAHGTRQIGKGKGHGVKRKNREKRGIGEAGKQIKERREGEKS